MTEQAAKQRQSKLRILIADDHQIVRDGLKMLVNRQLDMEVAAEANDGRSAIEKAKEARPDIAVLDISMPGINGLEATKHIKRACPNVKVITLTRHVEAAYLQQLLEAGVSGYVLKQSSSSELIRAIRAVATGASYLDPAVTSKFIGSYIKQGAESPELGGGISEREEEVLRLIVWGYSNKDIAANLDISVKTVEAHKANALRKLGLSSRIGIVRYALLRGWLKDD